MGITLIVEGIHLLIVKAASFYRFIQLPSQLIYVGLLTMFTKFLSNFPMNTAFSSLYDECNSILDSLRQDLTFCDAHILHQPTFFSGILPSVRRDFVLFFTL